MILFEQQRQEAGLASVWIAAQPAADRPRGARIGSGLYSIPIDNSDTIRVAAAKATDPIRYRCGGGVSGCTRYRAARAVPGLE